MTLKLDHIAIVVADLEKAVEAFRDKLGLPCDKIETVDAQQARVAFFDVGGAHLELVSPSQPDSALGRSLAKRGEGLHHVCFEVPSLEESIASLTAKGAVMAGPSTPGANGTQVVFVHPKSMNGVLVELVQKPAGGSGDGAH
jgi:methylmalonyl-CoA/ethylmalonyl-CoA epimerase